MNPMTMMPRRLNIENAENRRIADRANRAKNAEVKLDRIRAFWPALRVYFESGNYVTEHRQAVIAAIEKELEV